MTQEEIIQVPTIVNHHSHNHEHVEQTVPMIQEEIVHQYEVPSIVGSRLPFSPKYRSMYLAYGMVLPSNRW